MSSVTEVSTSKTWCFPKGTVEFLRALKANNNRDWFNQNKSVYEASVKQPADQFCALMTNELHIFTGMTHTSKVYRVYRDVRFSKDKTPYNTHLHICFFPQTTGGQSPVWFFGLEPDLIAFGAGMFAFEKPTLEIYRNLVDGPDGKKLTLLVDRLRGDGVRFGNPELKRVPSGFDRDHEYAEFLRYKGLTAWCDSKDTAVASQPDLIKFSVSSFDRLRPLVDWLKMLSPRPQGR